MVIHQNSTASKPCKGHYVIPTGEIDELQPLLSAHCLHEKIIARLISACTTDEGQLCTDSLPEQFADVFHGGLLCFRPFRASKFGFVDTLRVVLSDVKWFLLFLFFTMWVSAR